MNRASAYSSRMRMDYANCSIHKDRLAFCTPTLTEARYRNFEKTLLYTYKKGIHALESPIQAGNK